MPNRAFKKKSGPKNNIRAIPKNIHKLQNKILF